ncbi:MULTISPECIES: hypothetical protein [Pseudomonas]|jgi:hypothetical protein|uniref:HK97 gp10 family phage protein n=1 Tax=Pseudomonas putida (strain ATCC 47054 / DSM 6125 / CFBP 8728 / NCIMB 11950 / KT2440) TaxID=160488 RepID=Q88G53_PSEPK|nr:MULTISPECIES: hypothetical protein [Pseudomonas]AAN69467.1 conserved protein of unknown function [Pseudomonas putida KT2440]KMU94714.1 hypothetical protein AC138_17995 [Pseudomonas putida]KMY31112.1 hypothetical protein AA993_19795 [Pseudomonas putida]MDD2082040.1 hypothetical protein [Pseudomonas putida]QXZ06507.1 hypothetical protein HG554_20220 [Pseudomonas putida]
MANSASVDGYLHIEGFDQFGREIFDKKQIRKGMRKAGRLVSRRAQLNLALARGQDNYPVSRTGRTVESITFKVSRAGFLVKVLPRKTSGMRYYYPAYLHYGVKQGHRMSRLKPGESFDRAIRERESRKLREARRNNGWLITPRANYMEDALQDEKDQVQSILRAAFAAALR